MQKDPFETKKDSQPVIEEQKQGSNRQTQHNPRETMKEIAKKHPDCIPVFFVRHEAAPDDFPKPTHPFILFRKDLKIEQCMISLYNQIQKKGLYFFCLRRVATESKKGRHVLIKPGPTIQEIYGRYGNDGFLTLIYGDQNIGLGGMNKLEKWLLRILIFLGVIWASLMIYPYYIRYTYTGTIFAPEIKQNSTEFSSNSVNQSPEGQQTFVFDNQDDSVFMNDGEGTVEVQDSENFEL